MRRKRIGTMVLALFLVLMAGLPLFAEGQKEAGSDAVFPAPRTQVKYIITHGIGGSVDTAARGIAPYLEKYLGVPVVPQNMEGSGGRRAMEYVFAAKPDGYTIVASAYPSRLLGQLLYPESKYKMKEFTHLGSITGGDARIVWVAKDSPYQTFADLAQDGKNRTLTGAGGGGLGTLSQVQTILLTQKCGLNAKYIPYESGAQVLNAVLGKEVDFGVWPISNALQYLQEGIRVLAVHDEERSPEMPDVPTLKELGYEGVGATTGTGLWAPPGTPDYVVKKYDEALTKAFQDPEYLAWAKKVGQMLHHLGPEAFKQQTLRDEKNFGEWVELMKEDAARQNN